MTPEQVPEAKRTEFQHFVNLLAPARAWHRPRMRNARSLDPKRPGMVVVNHSVNGLGTPFIISELYRRRRIMARALVVKGFFHLSLYRRLVGMGGFVEGNRAVCEHLMQRGEWIALAPGGLREALKSDGQQYQLLWDERLGFVKMAVRFGYPIIPLAVVGMEDAVDIVMDPDEIMATPLGMFFRESGIYEKVMHNGNFLYPLVRGIGPSMVPRPERAYLCVGDAIETGHLKGETKDL
ncbi:MAG: 1-acyl-sn-glycerol-3-phosphate acyltransferase [Bacteroidota bacterium]